jgi:carboxymethylenebutenolidase
MSTHDQVKDQQSSADVSRRDFVAIGLAAGIGAAASTASAADLPVTEKDVNITTPDGTCDAAFVYPSSGSHPAVVIWPDAFGLRPSMRNMAKRLAAQGYSVLVPNPFYRVSKAPQFVDASSVNFQAERAKITPLMGSINAPGTVEKDIPAFIAFLDMQSSVDRRKKIGTQGYCMGGALVVRTAATAPDRIGAGASFHGGGLVTPMETSPHLLAPKIKAKMYFGIAASDDKQQPDAKDKLKEAFGSKAEVEVYQMAQHGWCVPDMPKGADGMPIYKMDDAEKAWSKLLVLYKSALV